MFVALLMAGCGEEAQPSEDVDMTDTAPESSQLSERVDMTNTAPKKDDIETAVEWSKLQDRGGVMYLLNEETPFSGFSKSVYENGQKKMEYNWKDGKPDGLWTDWHENGQKRHERNYKDDKFMSAEVWKPNGEKCPVTNLKDGNGVWVLYNEDGTEEYRFTYKDGERVRD